MPMQHKAGKPCPPGQKSGGKRGAHMDDDHDTHDYPAFLKKGSKPAPPAKKKK